MAKIQIVLQCITLLVLGGAVVLIGCVEEGDDSSGEGDADTDSDADGDTDVDCETCHTDFPPTTGKHQDHQLKCFNCHDTVVDKDNLIISQEQHDDENSDIKLHNSGVYDAENKTCEDACHHEGTVSW